MAPEAGELARRLDGRSSLGEAAMACGIDRAEAEAIVEVFSANRVLDVDPLFTAADTVMTVGTWHLTIGPPGASGPTFTCS